MNFQTILVLACAISFASAYRHSDEWAKAGKRIEKLQNLREKVLNVGRQDGVIDSDKDFNEQLEELNERIDAKWEAWDERLKEAQEAEKADEFSEETESEQVVDTSSQDETKRDTTSDEEVTERTAEEILSALASSNVNLGTWVAATKLAGRVGFKTREKFYRFRDSMAKDTKSMLKMEKEDHPMGKFFRDMPVPTSSTTRSKISKALSDKSTNEEIKTNSDLDEHWTLFKEIFSKEYSTDTEELNRRAKFEKNVYAIIAKNLLSTELNRSLRLQVNKFSDSDLSEVKNMYMGYKPVDDSIAEKYSAKYKRDFEDIKKRVGSKSKRDLLESSSSTENVDWRDTGCVTPIKNQGGCGSCWAFSATQTIESLDCLWNLKALDSSATAERMSQQQLIDCSIVMPDGTMGNYGCSGGWMQLGFVYILENGGIDKEVCYDYTGSTSTSCHFVDSCVASTDYGYFNIDFGDEDSLKYSTENIGPIAIAVDADIYAFIFYESGVLNDDTCLSGIENLDHGVQIVGYGELDGEKYWTVRNSWGVDWGDEGYLKIARDADNMCGVASDASFPAVEGLVGSNSVDTDDMETEYPSMD